MPNSSLPPRGRVALIATIVVALLIGFALPNPTVLVAPSAGVAPASTPHLQQNWGKSLLNPPAALSDCIGTGGNACYNPGTILTWQMVLDVCKSSTTVCTGATQLTIKPLHILALLEPGESYLSGTETYATSPSATAVFTSGSCTAAGAPTLCASFTPTGSYLEWNFSSPSLTGHPQATFTYNVTLDGTDGMAPIDYAIANYTVQGLDQNPIVDGQVFIANPILDISKSCPVAVENNSAISYNISLTNTGHENASSVTMVDNAPTGVTFTSGSATAPVFTVTPSQGSWTGTVPANGSVNVSLSGTVGTAATSVTNSASYTSVPDASSVVHRSASCTTQVLHPKIAVHKTATPFIVSNLTANTITVTAEVTNIGDTTLYNISAIDNVSGTLTCLATTLAPGASTNCTQTYSLPLGDPLNWSNDTVNASGNDKLGTIVRANDNASVRIVHPSIAVAKTVDPTVVSNLVANTINVTAMVTNTGDTALYNLTVFDTLAGNLTCPSSVLPAGASDNCTGSYVIPLGTTASFSNDTVTALADDAWGNVVGPVNANATVVIVHPSISVVKSVDPTVVSNLVANTITVHANVTNTGDAPLSNISVNDSLAGLLTCPFTTLAANASMVCSGTYVIPKGTSATYSNDTVVVTADDQFGNPVGPVSDNASVLIVHPGLRVVKTVSPTVVSNLVTNTINVTARVINTGDAALSSVGVVDSLAGTLTCPSSTLAVGASMNCTGSYTIPAGTTANYSNDTVNASAEDQFGNPLYAADSASVEILHPAIGVVKAVTPTVVSNLVTNTITVYANVTNTGDAPLSNLTVIDTLAGPLTCPGTTLAVGATVTCTGTYTIPAGTTANYSNDTVFANGTDQFGNPVSANDSASVEILHPAIEVVKAVTPTTVSNLVTNTITVYANVTNTGDAPLSNLTVVDTLAGPLTCPGTTLAVGVTMTCTGTYTIPAGTTADYSNDTVLANATDQFGNPVSANDSASVEIVHPGISVVKVVDPTVVSNLVNTTVDVTANVTNTGDTTLFGITVVDSLAGALSCPSSTLAPGASMNCTGSYVIPAGTTAAFSNDTVNATGQDGFSNSVSAEANASVVILHPSLEVIKSVDPTIVSNLVANTISVTVEVINTGDAPLSNLTVVDTLAGTLSCPSSTLAVGASMNCTGSYTIPAGTTANYSNDTAFGNGTDQFGNALSGNSSASVQIVHPGISVVKVVDPTVVSNLVNTTVTVRATVTNTGDTPLSGIVVTDTLAGTLTCPSSTLAVGASMNCTGSYVIPKGTSANYSNDTVFANGTDRFGNPLSANDSASVVILHPAIEVVKAVTPTTVSNLVTNTITVYANVTNTGDAPLSNLTVVDTLAGPLTCPETTLAVGVTMTCTGTYTIPKGTSANYSNDTVFANATDQFGHPLGSNDSASVDIVHPALRVVKVVDPTIVSNLVANTISVEANVTNLGDTTLFDVSVVDTLAGTLSCPSFTLASGASMVCTGSYTIPKGTSANYSNDTVFANATDLFGNPLSANDSASVQIVHPGISVVKVVDPTVVSNLDNTTVTVTATVRNTGDTPLSGIVVTDTLAGTLTCPSSTLAVGASMNCTGSYVIPKGTGANYSNDTVFANGTDRFGNPLSSNDSASVEIVHPGISVVKVVDPTVVSNLVGNTIDVTVVVTNTGDTPIYNLSVTDSIAGALSCATTTLAVGASTNCTGTYTIAKGTTADWSNDTATATGDDGFGHGLTGNDSASVRIVHPSLSVVKTVDPTLVSDQVNSTITITAKVTNTGDTPLYNLSVTDSIAGTLSCPSTTLAAGASMNCTGSYVIPKGTSADWSNDTVSAQGNDRFGNQVGPETSEASVEIIHPAISVVKSVDPTSVLNNVNNTITVTAVVTNTGDTTLYNVTVVDSIAGTLTCPSTTLAAGASMNCTGSYVIPAGTPAGYSNDTVTASGCDSTDACVNDSSNASVRIQNPTTGVLLDTNLCSLPGNQFTIVYGGGTPPKLSSTNPGQFYYNVFSSGGMVHGTTLSVVIPYPFVTTGSNPVQVFEHLPPTCPSSPPSSNVNSEFSISRTTWGLSAFSPQALGSVVTVTFTLTGPSIPSGTPLWFAIHLNYGLKGLAFQPLAPGSSGCPNPPNTGVCARMVLNPSLVIGSPQPYAFSNSWSGSGTVTSVNSFAKGANPVSPTIAAATSETVGLRIVVGLLFAVVGQVVTGGYVRRSDAARAPKSASVDASESPAPREV